MADRFRIDSEKISLHPVRVAQWVQGRDDWETAKEIFPIYVEVSPVGYCNHECTFCGVDYMLDRPEKPHLDRALLLQALTDMHEGGVRSVMFAGAGEPLLYKPLPEVLAHAGALGLDTSITTNGVLMTEAWSRKALAAPTLRWIKVSLNAGDAETYARIHRAPEGDFERVFKNLADAVRVRRELGSNCTIGAQMVALPEVRGSDPKRPLVQTVVPSNIATALPLAERLRDIGVDYLVVKPYSQHLMSSDSRVYDGTQYGTRSWSDAVEAVSTKDFNVVVRHQTMAHLEDGARGYDKCHATPFQWAYVEADGEVWGCSAYLGRTEHGKQYGDDRFRYGSLHAERFGDLWRGERRRANWAYVRDGLDISECRQNCRMHQVNLYLERVLHPAAHDAFI